MFKLGSILGSKRSKLVFELKLLKKVVVDNKRFFVSGKVTYLFNMELWMLRKNQNRLGFRAVRWIHRSSIKGIANKKDEVENFDEERSLMYFQEFEKWGEKNKKTFLETVKIYKKHARNRAGHVEFIKAALKKMKEHGVHRDLECYKKIIDILPKGPYISKNIWLAAAMYFPRQQNAVLDLLKQMGHNGVWPDAELDIMIKNIFGKKSVVNEKFEYMLYWSIKWKNKSPFKLPEKIPSDPLIMAKIAIERITSVDPQTEITVLETSTLKDSIDKTWIVSGQSPKQKKLLQKHPHEVPVIVEGGNLVWLRDKAINYFILKADGDPLPFVSPKDTSDISNLKSKFFNPNFKEVETEKPSVHEQDDGIVYAVCATGSSSKDSLLSWIRILENMGNSILTDIPVLFRFHEKQKLPVSISEALVQKDH